jgi:hypothetical protein
MYIIQVKEGNKLWRFATDSLCQFIIPFLLFYKIILSTPWPPNLPILQSPKLFVDEGLILCIMSCGLDLQARQQKNFLCFLYLHWGSISTYVVKITHTNKICFFVYTINIPDMLLYFIYILLYAITMIHKTTETSRET